MDGRTETLICLSNEINLSCARKKFYSQMKIELIMQYFGRLK